MAEVCTVCGGTQFTTRQVLWPALVAQWQLSPQEAEYINRQQGRACTQCGANLRSIALANAIRAHLGTSAVLAAVNFERRAILEINEAGSLSPVLRRAPGYVFAAYPAVDMQAMPYADGSFDLVTHSDTLEHVPDPRKAMSECRRVLKRGGALCFTVPIVVGRLSRTRAGLSPSYHGSSGAASADMQVHTEFGADAWALALEAGFDAVSLSAVAYPAAIAITALRR